MNLPASRFTEKMALTLALSLLVAVALLAPVAAAQASPCLAGATALQSNILAWLTPVAEIGSQATRAVACSNSSRLALPGAPKRKPSTTYE